MRNTDRLGTGKKRSTGTKPMLLLSRFAPELQIAPLYPMFRT
jgi:hypothetical protein